MSKAFHGILNYILMSLNSLLTFALYALLSAYRRLHIETYSYRKAESLLGSAMTDLFLRREFIAVPILLLAVMFLAEFSKVSYKSKVQLNIFVFAAICAHAIFITIIPHVF